MASPASRTVNTPRRAHAPESSHSPFPSPLQFGVTAAFTPLLAPLVALLFAFALSPFAHGAASTPDADTYTRTIKPFLQNRCYSCHGALQQKAGLRTDTVPFLLQGGKSGPSLQPGRPDRSPLLERVGSTDIDQRMPPEHEGEPLSAEQIATLRSWIAAGAPAPDGEKPETDPRDHWSFQPIRRPVVPAPPRSYAPWTRNPIDAFLASDHAAHQLTPQPEATPQILFRRIHFDLIGLPPTPDAIAAFESDPRPDRYERAVEQLLADPRHGERWARHWMDIWRYSDWWGLGAELRNSQKHIWHWRDWIVESLNEGLPYSEMLRQMLAADELYPTDPAKLRATGFLARNYFLFNRNTWMEDAIEHVGKGLLGLTLNCAKCHDHKYDPITQKDYYRIRAFFEPYHARLDLVPGELDPARDGIPRAFDALLQTPTFRFVRGQDTQPDKSDPLTPALPAFLGVATPAVRTVPLPPTAWQPERQPWILAAHESRARAAVDSARAAANAALAAYDAARASSPTNPASPTANLPQPAREKELVSTAAQFQLHTAELDLRSVLARAEASRASWARIDAAPNPPKHLIESERRLATEALYAERALQLSRAKQTVAQAELQNHRASPDKTESTQKDFQAAREALAKLEHAALSPIPETNRYQPFIGARWTTTRFIHPDRDDPPLEFPANSSGRRSALADWIVHPRNPLAARVAANHLWSRHFGEALVSPSFDLGRKYPKPAQAELLDWLSAELIEHNWDLKRLHRLIVTSAAYRMSSGPALSNASRQRDPDNRRLWRRSPTRLEAELVRDSILACAQRIEPALGGPPVPASAQNESRRRSLYFFHSNNERNRFLTTFDAATVNECYRRDQSIVPQQALALSNSAFVTDSAAQIARHLLRSFSHPGSTPQPSQIVDAEFTRKLFLQLLARDPSSAELDACAKALSEWRDLESNSPDKPDALTAYSRLAWALLNHNDFVTIR